MNKYSAAFLICFFSAMACIAQDKEFVFTHISKEDRLLSNGVNQVIKDSKGFIWFATINGLQLFDGKRMQIFQHVNGDNRSLPGNNVERILEDSRKRLWVFTSEGPCIYDGLHFSFIPVPIEFEKQNNIYSINKAYEDDKKNIWITLYPGGLFLLDSSQHRFRSYATIWPRCAANIYGITQDHAGRYWLATDSGLIQYDPVQKKYFDHKNNPASLKCFRNERTYGAASAFYKDRNDKLWMVFWIPLLGPNFFSYDIKKDELVSLGAVTGNTLGFLTDGAGNTWAYGDELSLYNNATNSFTVVPKKRNDRLGVDYDEMRNLYEDDEHNLWCSTNAGIYEFNPMHQRFTTVTLRSSGGNELIDANINHFIETSDGHIIVLGWGGDGLYFYDTAFNRIPNLYGFNSKQFAEDGNYLMAWSGLQDSRDQIWIGAQAGRLMTIDPSTHHITKYHDPAFADKTIRSMAEDSRGNLWFGSQNNVIVRWIRETKKFVQLIPPPPSKYDLHTVLRFFPGDENDMWVGSSGGGLLHFDLDGNVLRQYLPDMHNSVTVHSASVNEINRLSKDMLLLATGSGIVLFNTKLGSFIYLTEKLGLSTDNIISMCWDNNRNVWFTTSEGLSKFNLTNKKVTNYAVREGITAQNFYAASTMKFKNGKIAFGNSRGFIYFNPEEVSETITVPDAQITSFSVFANMLPVDSLFQNGNSIHLNYTENFISIRFSAMSFLLNDKLEYHYMLEGLDRDWVKAYGEANYTNLPGGEYTFKVKSVSSDGVESKNITSFKIIISPPFWKRWWFYVLLFLVAAVIMYFIYKIRINRLNDMEKVRTRIARDLHDDMGSTLSTINILSAMAKTKIGDDPVKTGEYIGKISDNSQRMMEAMDDIVWSIKPTNDSMQKITARMREFATGILEAKDIELEFKVEEMVNDIKMDMEARRDFFLVFKEAVNNVAKYSHCTKCCIRIALHQHRLLLDVEDNGIGFDVNTADSGNGLSNMMKRAESLKGRVLVQSLPGKGSHVTLNMPVQ